MESVIIFHKIFFSLAKFIFIFYTLSPKIKLFRIKLNFFLILLFLNSKLLASQPILKIGILETDSNIIVSMQNGGKIYTLEKNTIKTVAVIKNNQPITVINPNFLLQLKYTKKPLTKDKNIISPQLFYNKELVFRPNDFVFTINNEKSYRGNLILKYDSKKKKIVAINEVEIEKYLQGVVGAEISSLAPFEALKAQAVIARTYSLANLGKHSSDGYDLCSTEHCQVYEGIKSERTIVSNAIAETKGIIMIYDNKPISSVYHSTCGGLTSDNEKVFGGKPVAYLRRVICPFCKTSNYYKWIRKVPLIDLLKIFKNNYPSFDMNQATKIKLLSQEYLDRVESITIISNEKEYKLKGTLIRQILRLPSTTFILTIDTNNTNKNTHIFSTTKKSENAKLNISKNFYTPSKIITSKISSKYFNKHSINIIAKDKLYNITLIKPKELHVISYYKESTNISDDLSCQGNKIISINNYYLDGKFVQELFLNKEGLDTVLYLQGRGNGHQVGLCQFGAIEMARRGWNYRQILPYYYKNTKLRLLRY